MPRTNKFNGLNKIFSTRKKAIVGFILAVAVIGYAGLGDYGIDPPIDTTAGFQSLPEVLSESTTVTEEIPETQPPPPAVPPPVIKPVAEKYSSHTVTASIYGIGEDANDSNNNISNVPSAWSSDTVVEFGGVDIFQGNRTFIPKHNTFYFALPAMEFNESGLIPGSREKSPWASEVKTLGENNSLFKGRWVRVSRSVSGQTKTIYAQWQDVGPNEEQDYGYVFGDGRQKPKNAFGVSAGIDLSPDASRGLGFSVEEGSATVTWSFVDASAVPNGPWKSYPSIDNNIRW